jgi:hypothetical protein
MGLIGRCPGKDDLGKNLKTKIRDTIPFRGAWVYVDHTYGDRVEIWGVYLPS